MTTYIINIKSTMNTDDKIISKLMNVLINEGFVTERYLGINSKIIMAKKEIR